MNILLTNDDGIEAEGIKQLAKAISQFGALFVVAPTEQKSACGHGITIHEAIGVRETSFHGAEKAYAIEGTPADCVKIGLRLLKRAGIEIDLVYSGINHGSNLGTDTLYSGTVSAAVEGALCGKPAIAVSIDAKDPRYYETACDLAVKVGALGPEKLTNGTVININVPDLAPEEIRGTKVAKLGVREYSEWFDEEQSSDGVLRYRYGGRPVFRENLPDDIDITASEMGYATITPLHYDLTDHQLIEEVKSWGIK